LHFANFQIQSGRRSSTELNSVRPSLLRTSMSTKMSASVAPSPEGGHDELKFVLPAHKINVDDVRAKPASSVPEVHLLVVRQDRVGRNAVGEVLLVRQREGVGEGICFGRELLVVTTLGAG